ncbi:aldose epimerase family protein [Deinococcus roseus]|uniref:Aldose 1-epimerase n=1 Tax=Deinococcus roseus TaxID=392414 RepID=A0ABQ2D1W1_9DEIO|nr:aldose epimerase family protein [Deinococcus roseus]GGJ36489.1 aldose 1-epimerase [Deinococcus roseus]
MTQTTSQPFTLQSAPWGTLPSGREVTQYTLTGLQGLQVQVLDYGGTITSILAPDRHGQRANIVLGHPELAPYLSRDTSCFFGALIGRYANRIHGGQFTLEGQQHQVSQNEGSNSLHGGHTGLDNQMWQVEELQGANHVGLNLALTLPDGSEGHPGALDVQVQYLLNEQGELRIHYSATTTRATHLNLTQHTYWNLSGNPRNKVLNHEITVHADQYLPINDQLIPTGELQDVAGTPFDFRSSGRLGQRIEEEDVQLQRAGGYDHTYVLRGTGFKPAATLHEPVSGRVLEVFTTEPGMQLYSGNFLPDHSPHPCLQNFGRNAGVCLETQHFPDSPNQPHFPSTVLWPGEVFESITLYRFGVQS